jgi:hypothetical protein
MYFNLNDLNDLVGFTTMNMNSTTIYKLTIWLGDAIVEQRNIKTQDFFMQQEVIRLVFELSNNPSPMKLLIEIDYYLEDRYKAQDSFQYTNPAWDRAHEETNEKC